MGVHFVFLGILFPEMCRMDAEQYMRNYNALLCYYDCSLLLWSRSDRTARGVACTFFFLRVDFSPSSDENFAENALHK